MNRLSRVLLFIYSVILALSSLILLYAFFDEELFPSVMSALNSFATGQTTKFVYLGIFAVLLISCVYSVSSSIISGRLSKTRIKQTELGSVDIGPDAIESIALNSAKSAQVGIKSAKVHVAPAKNNKIKVTLNAAVYSNVDIPGSMTKVQEKIKKDVERYTGINVESVIIKVKNVEPIVAKVDK